MAAVIIDSSTHSAIGGLLIFTEKIASVWRCKGWDSDYCTTETNDCTCIQCGYIEFVAPSFECFPADGDTPDLIKFQQYYRT